MRITIEDFKKLTTDEQEFVITHGADNCQLVKFSPDIADILSDYFGESTYDEEDINMLDSLAIDEKWHIMYFYDDYEYFLCGDDNLVFVPDCFEDESDDFSLYIKQMSNQK